MCKTLVDFQQNEKLSSFRKLHCFDTRALCSLAETSEVGGQGGHVPPPQVLGYQLTLFGPRGADYAHHITTAPPIVLMHELSVA